MVIQPPLYKSDLNGFVTGKKRNHQQPLDLGHVECLWLGGKNPMLVGFTRKDQHGMDVGVMNFHTSNGFGWEILITWERPKLDLC